VKPSLFIDPMGTVFEPLEHSPTASPISSHDQVGHAYGNNITRLQAVKRRFDTDGFFSATPLPA
jgi:berberine-like enzyme